MAFTLSPYMNLPVPVVGNEAGPQYATDINNSLSRIDSHNHTAGSGVTLSQASLNINGSLLLNNNPLTTISYAAFSLQPTAPTASTAPNSLYVDSNGNLHYINTTTDIQVSSGNALNVTSSGISSGSATASFISSQLTVYSNASNATPGNISGGSLLLGNNLANSNYLTLSPPSAMAANYTLVLPSIPVQTESLQIDTSGNITPTLITTALLASAVAQALCPPGSMMAYAGSSTPPAGWLLCDGSAVSRTTYSALFAAISGAYGTGDGSTTFNLPDTRGLFLRGVDQGKGYDPDTSTRTNGGYSGANTGDNQGSFQQSGYESHQHFVSDPGHKHSIQVATAGGATISPISSTSYVIGDPQGSPTGTATIPIQTSTTGLTVGAPSTGNAYLNQTTPTNLYVFYIIKT